MFFGESTDLDVRSRRSDGIAIPVIIFGVADLTAAGILICLAIPSCRDALLDLIAQTGTRAMCMGKLVACLENRGRLRRVRLRPWQAHTDAGKTVQPVSENVLQAVNGHLTNALSMVGFKVFINGELFSKIGTENPGVASLTAFLNSHQPGQLEIAFDAGASSLCADGTRKSIQWEGQLLKEGDRIAIEVCELDEISPPVKEAVETRDDRRHQKAEYYKQLGQELGKPTPEGSDST